jgi:ferric-dicitrate binding protein FerR (iron transport regulator)
MRSFHRAIVHAVAGAALSAFARTAGAEETPRPAPPAAPAQALAADPQPSGDPHRGDVQRTVGWALCGAGTVAVAMGGGFAFVAHHEHDDASAETGSARLADERSASQLANGAAFLLVAGGAAVASGVIVLLTAPNAQTSIATDGREILVRGTF